MGVTFSSCGTYQSVYNDDGIYNDRSDDKIIIVKTEDKRKEVDDSYFTKELNKYRSNTTGSIFTDVDSYNSSNYYDDIESDTIQENNYISYNNSPWGYSDDNDDVVININMNFNRLNYWDHYYGYGNYWNYRWGFRYGFYGDYVYYPFSYGYGYSNIYYYNPYYYPYHPRYNNYYYGYGYTTQRNSTYTKRDSYYNGNRRNSSVTTRRSYDVTNRANTTNSRVIQDYNKIKYNTRRNTNSTIKNATYTPIRRSSTNTRTNNVNVNSSTRRSTTTTNSNTSSTRRSTGSTTRTNNSRRKN